MLPGVALTVTHTETGLTRTTVTNETGAYALPNLPLGPYRLEASLPGFRTYVQTGIVLQVNSSPVINPVLNVGELAETVEVIATAAMVETRAVGVGQIVENERILALPLNGRNVAELILLSGQAVQTGSTAAGSRSVRTGDPALSIGGGLRGGTTYMLDGAMYKNLFDANPLPYPFPDALQEFKVETSGLSAEHVSGASVSAVTKSGTNLLHGTLFEFARLDALNARNYFAATNSTLRRHQFGGTAGGPIIQNRLFFFGGYQGMRLRQDPADQRARIATIVGAIVLTLVGAILLTFLGAIRPDAARCDPRRVGAIIIPRASAIVMTHQRPSVGSHQRSSAGSHRQSSAGSHPIHQVPSKKRLGASTVIVRIACSDTPIFLSAGTALRLTNRTPSGFWASRRRSAAVGCSDMAIE